MKVKIKKLHADAVIPKYASEGASGFDLVALENTTVQPSTTRLVRTGIAVAVPKGYELQVRPRSGLSLKTPLRVSNSPGTVDSDFRGEVGVIMTNTSNFTAYDIKKGDRIAQGVICPVLRVELLETQDLEETARGASGFGSTGK